jgi:hypothetical protein
MVTGRLPFDGKTLDDFKHAHLKEKPAIPRQLPVTIRTVLASCLAKEPAERPESAGALYDLLEEARAEFSTVQSRRARRFHYATPSSEDAIPYLPDEDRAAADQAVMQLPAARELRADLAAALSGPRPLIVVSGHLFGLREPMIRGLLDAPESRLYVAARAVLSDEGEALMSVLAERLDIMARSSTGLRDQILAACVGATGERNDVRSVVHLHVRRPLKSAELAMLSDLARRGQRFNLLFLIVCSSETARALQSEMEAAGQIDLYRAVTVAPVERSDRHAYIDMWTNVATGDRLRWSADARRMSEHLETPDRPLARLVHNACAMTLVQGERVVTSWSVLQGAKPKVSLLTQAEVRNESRATRPVLWPDEPTLALLHELRAKEATQDSIKN